VDAEDLRRELEVRELVLLGVARHASRPEVRVVYLHGNAGQWMNGAALQVIQDVPGVLDAVASVQSPLIILVRVSTGAQSGTATDLRGDGALC
jgi:hypothetical protein